MSEIAVLCYY